MNTAKLRKLQKWILEEPRRFDMLDWSGRDAIVAEQKPPCNTVGCLAGMTCHMEGGKLGNGNYAIFTIRLPGEVAAQIHKAYIEDYARNVLGLTQPQANNLFLLRSIHGAGRFFETDTPETYEGYWPKVWEAKYLAAQTVEQKARVAARYIDFFIKTKGNVHAKPKRKKVA